MRYEIAAQRCYISLTTLREYLIEKGVVFNTFMATLEEQGIVVRRRAHVTLSAGVAELAGGQVWCVEINVAHPKMKGAAVTAPVGNVVPIRPLSKREGGSSPPPG